jgi:pyruvate dehydrogenase E2 component (dihydrolipoamide acetyltransferase)
MLTANVPLAGFLTAIIMPQWGPTMEEGTIVAWRVREGDYVEAGAEIAEVETSKVSNAIEASTSGTVLRVVCEPWRQMRVGGLLAVLGPADSDPSEIDAWIEEHDAWVEADETDCGMTTGTLEVESKSIAYAEAGAGEPPLVLIHSLGADQTSWRSNVEALAGGRRTICLDLPGHGKSTFALGRGDLAQLADDVGAALDQLDVGRAVFVGHGLGAAVALQLARDRPARVAGLVAIAGLGFGGELSREFVCGLRRAERCYQAASMARLMFADPVQARRAMLDHRPAPGTASDAKRQLDAIAAAILAPGVAEALRSALAEMDIPILAIHGALDRVIAPPQALPTNVAAVLIQGVGHMPHVEAAAQVNELVAGFAAEIA